MINEIILSELSNNINFIKISLSNMQRCLNIAKLAWNHKIIITVTKTSKHYCLVYITSIYFLAYGL